MNSHIRTMMFSTPVTIFPVSAADSVGDVVELPSFETAAYVYDESKVILNAFGEKEISTRQVYLPLAEVSQIKSTYLVSCLDSVKARIVGRQEFRGRRNKTLLGVLYLP